MSSMDVEEEAKGLLASKLLKDLHLRLTERDATNISNTLETMARTGDVQHLLELGLLQLLQKRKKRKKKMIISRLEFDNIEASLNALMKAIEKKYPDGIPDEIKASGENLLSVVLADSQFLLTTAKVCATAGGFRIESNKASAICMECHGMVAVDAKGEPPHRDRVQDHPGPARRSMMVASDEMLSLFPLLMDARDCSVIQVHMKKLADMIKPPKCRSVSDSISSMIECGLLQVLRRISQRCGPSEVFGGALAEICAAVESVFPTLELLKRLDETGKAAFARKSAASMTEWISLDEVRRLTNLDCFYLDEVSDLFIAHSEDDGTICELEFNEIMINMALQSRDMSIEDQDKLRVVLVTLYDIFNGNQDGTVNSEEFLAGISILVGGDGDQKAQTAFDLYDVNGNGSLSMDEMVSYLYAVFRVLYAAEPATKERAGGGSPKELAIKTALQAFKEADKNYDNLLSFAEFRQWYS